MTSKASVLSLVSILLVASAVFLGNQRQAYADEGSLGEDIVCDVFTELGNLPLPPGAEHCADSGSGEEDNEGEFPPAESQCSDGIDNDGDGKTDFAPVIGDPGCSDIFDNDEGTDACPEGEHWDNGQCVPDTTEPTDVCPNLDEVQETVPEGYHLEDGQCVEDAAPADVCPNIDGLQESVPEGKEIVEGNCVDISSGGGGYSQGSYGGGSYSQAAYGGGNGPIAGTAISYPAGPGAVLGLATSTATDTSISCDQYLTSFIKPGADNDVEQVKRLQSFLNEFEETNLEVSGIYDASTTAAVHAFQTEHADTILMPWGIKNSTGFVYLTTRKTINDIRCEKLGIAFPLTAEEKAIIEKSRDLPAPTAVPVPVQKPAAVVPVPANKEAQPSSTTTPPKAPAVESSGSKLRNFLRSLFQRGE